MLCHLRGYSLDGFAGIDAGGHAGIIPPDHHWDTVEKLMVPGQTYRFKGAAPSHDEVWRALCDVLGRQLVKSECRPARSNAARPDWRTAEKSGGFLMEKWNTTFWDSTRRPLSITVNTFLRGDTIAATGGDELLQEAMATAMKQLGGETFDLDELRQSKD